MCILSIKVPIQKNSGTLFNDPRTWLSKENHSIESFACPTCEPSHAQVGRVGTIFYLNFWFLFLTTKEAPFLSRLNT